MSFTGATMEQQVGSTNSWMCGACELGSQGGKVQLVALVHGPAGSFGPVM